MKRNIISFLIGALLMLPVGSYAATQITAQYNNVKVTVDGQAVKTQVVGVVEQGKKDGKNYTFTKDIAEAMGGTVEWEGISQTLKISTPRTSLEQVVNDCKNSCVMIYAYLQNGNVSQGSGWVYNGYIITANHVIKDATRIDIFVDDSIYGVSGTKVSIDTDLDVAVLKADINLPSVKLGDSDKLIEGEKIVAITSPKGFQNAVDECVYTGQSYNYSAFHLGISETDMTNGSSGGAIFNKNSELIGMNIIGEANANDAIPINKLKPLIEKLK